jgi:hypothetical protein
MLNQKISLDYFQFSIYFVAKQYFISAHEEIVYLKDLFIY